MASEIRVPTTPPHVDHETLADVAARVSKYKDAGTKPHHMWRCYEPYLSPYRSRPIRLVEIGVHKGDSLRTFSRYFSAARILGLDVQLPEIATEDIPNVDMQVCDQRDADRLKEICAAFAPAGPDIIIDDASHVGDWSLQTFNALFPQLARRGLYVIEDWSTGYMPEWGDGAPLQPPALADFHHVLHRRIVSHDFGMVGFVKTVVDLARMGQPVVNRVVIHNTFAIVEKY